MQKNVQHHPSMSVDKIKGFEVELGYWARELSLEGSHPDAIHERTDPKLMERGFPGQLLTPLINERKRATGRKPRVLDVGSGPLSMLVHGALTQMFELTAADPLAARYSQLLKENDFDPGYPLVECFGEQLSEKFEEESFDLVWIHNALDHSQDPQVVLRECAKVLRPNGYLIFMGWSREGSAEHWYGLHRHDLYMLPDVRLMCDTRASLGRLAGKVNRLLPFVRRRAETKCINDGLPLEVVQASEPTTAVKKWMSIVWRKTAAS